MNKKRVLAEISYYDPARSNPGRYIQLSPLTKWQQGRRACARFYNLQSLWTSALPPILWANFGKTNLICWRDFSGGKTSISFWYIFSPT